MEKANRGARLRSVGRSPTIAARSRSETATIYSFAAGATLYAIVFCACRRTTTPVDWILFWRQSLFPDRIVANWFGDLSDDRAALGFADRLPMLGAALLVWLWAWGFGRLVLRVTRLDRSLSKLEGFVLAAGAGANLVSLYVLALGLAARLARAWLCAPLTFVTLAALAIEFHSLRESRSAANGPPTELSRPGWWLMLPAAVFGLAILAGALMPTYDFDALEYHLQAPKEFYQAGRIAFLAHNVYANMPLGAEMFSLTGMVVLGDWWSGGQAGQLAIAGYTLLTALALLAFGRR